MINTLIIAGLVFALLCVAAWHEGKDERRKAKQMKRMMAMLARMKTQSPFEPPWFQTGQLMPSIWCGIMQGVRNLPRSKQVEFITGNPPEPGHEDEPIDFHKVTHVAYPASWCDVPDDYGSAIGDSIRKAMAKRIQRQLDHILWYGDKREDEVNDDKL